MMRYCRTCNEYFKTILKNSRVCPECKKKNFIINQKMNRRKKGNYLKEIKELIR